MIYTYGRAHTGLNGPKNNFIITGRDWNKNCINGPKTSKSAI